VSAAFRVEPIGESDASPLSTLQPCRNKSRT
jgi:hypothetical protein